MFIELDDVFRSEGSSVNFDREVESDGSDDKKDSYSISGMHCVGSIANRSGTVMLSGTVDFDYTAPCDRCAEKTSRHYNVPLSHKLIERLSGDENDEYIALDSTRLELDELVREDVILSLPMRYLCSETCRGLCPQCGQNLNKGACGCKRLTDPRLDVLNSLLDQ